jgi:hypothetical protein
MESNAAHKCKDTQAALAASKGQTHMHTHTQTHTHTDHRLLVQGMLESSGVGMHQIASGSMPAWMTEQPIFLPAKRSHPAPGQSHAAGISSSFGAEGAVPSHLQS